MSAPDVFASAVERDASLTSPRFGATCLLKNTGELLIYYGAGIGWRPPWNTAWGEAGAVALPSHPTLATNTRAAVGLTLSFTPVLNRKYRLVLTATFAYDFLSTTASLALYVASGEWDSYVAKSRVRTGVLVSDLDNRSIITMQRPLTEGTAPLRAGRATVLVVLYYVDTSSVASSDGFYGSDTGDDTSLRIYDVGPNGGPVP